MTVRIQTDYTDRYTDEQVYIQGVISAIAHVSNRHLYAYSWRSYLKKASIPRRCGRVGGRWLACWWQPWFPQVTTNQGAHWKPGGWNKSKAFVVKNYWSNIRCQITHIPTQHCTPCIPPSLHPGHSLPPPACTSPHVQLSPYAQQLCEALISIADFSRAMEDYLDAKGEPRASMRYI